MNIGARALGKSKKSFYNVMIHDVNRKRGCTGFIILELGTSQNSRLYLPKSDGCLFPSPSFLASFPFPFLLSNLLSRGFAAAAWEGGRPVGSGLLNRVKMAKRSATAFLVLSPSRNVDLDILAKVRVSCSLSQLPRPPAPILELGLICSLTTIPNQRITFQEYPCTCPKVCLVISEIEYEVQVGVTGHLHIPTLNCQDGVKCN